MDQIANLRGKIAQVVTRKEQSAQVLEVSNLGWKRILKGVQREVKELELSELTDLRRNLSPDIVVQKGWPGR